MYQKFFIISSSFVPAIRDPMGGRGFMSIVGSLLQASINIAGLVAVVYIVIAGYNYIQAQGDQGKIDKAKKSVSASIYGLIYVILALAIKNTVEYILY